MLARVAAALGLAIVTLTLAPRPAPACEPIHTIKRVPPSPNPFPNVPTICWAGPCSNRLGAADTLGRFFVVKDPDAVIDYIAMTMDNGPLHQVLVSRATNSICGAPTGTVAGCTERFKVRTRACPLGGAPCFPREKMAVNLTLDQINTHTTGGTVVLSDGQEIEGLRTNKMLLNFEICCPDFGQFGLPGTKLTETTTYATRLGNSAASCIEELPRGTKPDVIPEVTFPCE